MDISGIELVVYSIASLLTSIAGGMSGGGGGFIMTPLLIFLGLSPAQAVATGKISGLAVTLGSLQGLKAHKVKDKRLVYIVCALAFIVGLLAPFAITNLNSDLYRRLLGVILLLMIPVLSLHKPGSQHRELSKGRQAFGFVTLILALGLQAVFSGGLGTLVVIVLMTLMGLSPLDANVTKRMSQVLLNSVIVLGVLGSGLIVWKVAAVGVVTCLLGGLIGSRIAVKRGDEFVKRILIIFVCIAALELLFG